MNFGIGVLLKEFVEELRKNWFSDSYSVLTERKILYSYFTNILTDVCVCI